MVYFILVFIAFTLLLFLRIGMVVIKVQNYSMAPALRDGDRVLVLRYWPARWIRKGQIVVVLPWLAKANRRLLTDRKLHIVPFIKRVVGISGDTVVSSLSELDEYHRVQSRELYDEDGFRMWHIPHNYIFVYGDNLPRGYDSLSWGSIPVHTVLGIVIMKLSSKSTSRNDKPAPSSPEH